MDHAPATPPGEADAEVCLPRRRGRSLPHRAARICGGFVSLVFLAIVAAGALLYSGPVDLGFLRERIVAELGRSFGKGHTVAVDAVHLGFVDTGLSARLDGMKVLDGDGRVVMSAPVASVSFDPLALFALKLQPKRLDISRMVLRLDIHPDGTVAIATGDPPATAEAPVVRPTPAPAPAAGLPDFAAEAKARRASVVGALVDIEHMFAVDGLLGQLQGVDISDGRLIVRHLGSGRDVMVDHVRVLQDQRESEGHVVVMQGVGRRGPLTIRLESRATDDGYQTSFSASQLSVSDLATVLGLPPVPREADSGLTLSGSVALDKPRQNALVRAEIRTGASRFSIDGTPTAMVDLDEARLGLAWNSADGIVAIDDAGFTAGGTRFDFSGRLVPDTSGPWRYAASLVAAKPVLEPLSGAERPLALDSVSVSGALDLVRRRIELPNILIRGANAEVSGGFMVQDSAEGAGLEWSLHSGRIDVRPALRIWPAFLAPDVRTYLIRSLSAGTLETLDIAAVMPPAILRETLAQRPIPEAALQGRFSISGATMTAVEGLPPLQGVDGSGTFTGRTVNVDVPRATLDLGNGRRIALTEGRFAVPDTAQHPAQAKIVFRAQGGADAAADLLARPPLRPERGQLLDPAQVKGNVDARISVSLPLVDKPGKDDVVTSLTATVGNLSIDKAFGGERLEGANLVIANEKHVTTAKGDGRLFGAPATIALRQGAGEAGDVTVQFTADDAMRAKRNLFVLPGLKGPVGVTFKAPVQKSSAFDEAQVTLDLTRAGLEAPGWSKPAGRAGKVMFAYQAGSAGTTLDNFTLDSSPVFAKGQIQLDTAGALKGAKFDQFRLSAGDSLQVSIEKAPKGFKITARGATFDARPFIRTGTGDRSASGGGGKADDTPADREVSIRLTSNILSGFNGEAMTNADLQLTNVGQEIRQFSLDAKLNGATVSGKVQPTSSGAGGLKLSSTDAGSFLRFVDIYNRMVGGRLDLDLSGPAEQQDGVMTVRDFVLRDEPALRSVAPRSYSPQGESTDITSSAGLSAIGGDVAFTKLRADFQRSPSKVVFRDAVMWGQQVGGSINGSIDYGRDRLRLTGTFVPAYQVNNFFSQVPLIGTLLGGGQYEGLFAVSFQIDGKVSAPVLHVSPLSAIAPGFLRKLFEFRQQQDGAPPAGASRPDSNR